MAIKQAEEVIDTKKKKNQPKSKLAPQVQDLMKFIFDMKKIEMAIGAGHGLAGVT